MLAEELLRTGAIVVDQDAHVVGLTNVYQPQLMIMNRAVVCTRIGVVAVGPSVLVDS